MYARGALIWITSKLVHLLLEEIQLRYIDWFSLQWDPTWMSINLTLPIWPQVYFMDRANFLISYIFQRQVVSLSDFGHFPRNWCWRERTIRVIIQCTYIPFSEEQRKWNIQGKTATITFPLTLRDFWIFTSFFEKLLYIQKYSLNFFFLVCLNKVLKLKISYASIFLKLWVF